MSALPRQSAYTGRLAVDNNRFSVSLTGCLSICVSLYVALGVRVHADSSFLKLHISQVSRRSFTLIPTVGVNACTCVVHIRVWLLFVWEGGLFGNLKAYHFEEGGEGECMD